jgi:hypothetical protein
MDFVRGREPTLVPIPIEYPARKESTLSIVMLAGDLAKNVFELAVSTAAGHVEGRGSRTAPQASEGPRAGDYQEIRFWRTPSTTSKKSSNR